MCRLMYVKEKVQGDRWFDDRTYDDLRLWGHMELIVEGDGEPALVQVQEAIRDKTRNEKVPQTGRDQGAEDWLEAGDWYQNPDEPQKSCSGWSSSRVVGHDGKGKEMLGIGDRVLAKVVRGRRSARTRSLQPATIGGCPTGWSGQRIK